ncbi:MAG: phage baseplate assembly protein V [Magnetococcales bacterium]|nr:phage baseplate assembly protein V [Magnetococcales bacterium]
MSDSYDISELYRLLDNLIRIGTIKEADYIKALVRVESGEQLTGWIPWLTRRASKDVDWWAPEVGEQVVILSPGGDPAQGVVLPSLYQTLHSPPANLETVRRVEFDDGAWVEYDRAAKILNVYTAGQVIVTAGQVIVTADQVTVTAGPVLITATDGVTIQGTLHVSGNISTAASLAVSGDIAADGEIIDGGGNTPNHIHK